MIKTTAIVICLFLLFSGCASEGRPSAVLTPSAETKIESLKVKAGWEVKWEEILARARKEGVVMLYTTQAIELRRSWQKAFEERYGIKMYSTVGSGASLSAKIFAERRAGLFLADVFTGGATNLIQNLKPAGALIPMEDKLILPEVADPKLWYGGKHMWVDKGHTVLQAMATPSGKLVFNKNLVKPGEIRELRDLLNPKWKGKIVMPDPTIPGTAATIVGVVVSKYSWGWDFWRGMADKQELTIIRDDRLVADWLALGKVAVGVAVKEDAYLRVFNAGAPVEMVFMKEVSYISGDCVGLMDKAPHPNGAIVFLNWLLSKQGQEISQKGLLSQSARVDLPTLDVPGWIGREPGIEYWNKNTEEFLVALEDNMKLAKEVFGPAMPR